MLKFSTSVRLRSLFLIYPRLLRVTKACTGIMRGNTNENWEIVSVFYSWEGHPILQIARCVGTLSPALIWLFLLIWRSVCCMILVTVCGRLRSLSLVPKPNWLWYWWLALSAKCLPVVLRCPLCQSEASVDWWWPMRGRVCCVVIVIVSHGYNVARHNN